MDLYTESLSDTSDKSTQLELIETQYLINKARTGVFIPPQPHCLVCGEDSMPGGKFCSVECRDEFDKKSSFYR